MLICNKKTKTFFAASLDNPLKGIYETSAKVSVVHCSKFNREISFTTLFRKGLVGA